MARQEANQALSLYSYEVIETPPDTSDGDHSRTGANCWVSRWVKFPCIELPSE
jgi:hypothetical protein